MRFFSRGWACGDLTDDECEKVGRDYVDHLSVIESRLPEPMRALARDISLHDAVIEQVRWDPGARQLSMTLVAALDNGRRHQAVDLTYLGAQMGERSIGALRDAARDRQTEILYTEVDIDDQAGLVHRLLFWPREEVTIYFGELVLAVDERSDGRVYLHPSFVEVRPDDEEP